MESNPCFLTTNSDTPIEQFSVLLLHKCTEKRSKRTMFWNYDLLYIILSSGGQISSDEQ